MPPSKDRTIGDTLSGLLVGGDPSMSLAERLFTMILQMGLNVACNDLTDCLTNGLMALLGVVVAWIVLLVLGIVATLVELWSVSCLQLIYAVGWVMIPLLLYERFAFLFDGFVKQLFGSMMYSSRSLRRRIWILSLPWSSRRFRNPCRMAFST